MSSDVGYEIAETIWSVVKQATPRMNASKQTRFNALECLRRIGKTVCLGGNDTLGHEVQEQLAEDDELSAAMLKIIKCMSIKERKELWDGWLNDKGEKFADKFLELVSLSATNELFEKLEEVVKVLEAASKGLGPEEETDSAPEEMHEHSLDADSVGEEEE